MIIVKGSFPVKEDEQPHALELVQALASASRGERGCLAYEVTSARFDVSSMDGDPIVEDVSEIAPVVLADNIILH